MSERETRYFERVGAAKTPVALAGAFRRGRRKVGDRVMFRNGSAPGGWRAGRVVACGTHRARVAFTFFNGRTSERSVPYADLQ
jgi:hypothetical protein